MAESSNGAVFVAERGEGDPVLFVHGSVVGATTWKKQRPLAKRWTTKILDRRGFGKSPDTDRDDFQTDAADINEALGDGAHLVAHSYGAIGAMLAAGERPEAVRSLTLVEPVAYAAAIEHPAVQRAVVDLIEYFSSGPEEPREFLEGFLVQMGIDMRLPEELPPSIEQPTRLLMNSHAPFAARLRLRALAREEIPTLVVSGGHSEAFEAICDALAEHLGAERATIPGATHAVPSVGGPFNERLEEFLTGAAQSRGA
jgi:pimeloyl-ACP methyl ester carboxylesterase